MLGANNTDYPTDNKPCHDKPQRHEECCGGIADGLAGDLLRLRPSGL